MNDYVTPVHAALPLAHRGPPRAGRRGADLHRALRRRPDERRSAASERPVHTVLSGPAGGVTSAMLRRAARASTASARLRHGRHLDRRRRSARRRADDLALDRGRRCSRPRCRRSTCAASAPAAARSPTSPTLTGSLRVGPRSAGAEPGPGLLRPRRHGTDRDATPTSCSATCRRGSLGGDDGARRRRRPRGRRPASARRSASTPEDAAKGIIDIANEIMLGALRVITVQRGARSARLRHRRLRRRRRRCTPTRWPRCSAATRCSCRPIPACCRRSASSRPTSRTSSCRPSSARPTALDPADVWSRFAGARRRRPTAGSRSRTSRPTDASIHYALDLRYEQQGFEVSVDVAADELARGRWPSARRASTPCTSGSTASRFHVPVRTGRAARGRARAAPHAADRRADARRPAAMPRPRIIETQPAYFDGAWQETPHYDRAELGVGNRIDGPAIIRQYDTTTRAAARPLRRGRRARQHPDLAGRGGE